MHKASFFPGITILIILLTCIIINISCAKKKDLSGIQELIEQLKTDYPTCNCEPYLQRYIYKGRKVFLLGYKGPLCNWTPVYYNQSGEKVTGGIDKTLDAFLAEATFEATVWTCTSRQEF